MIFELDGVKLSSIVLDGNNYYKCNDVNGFLAGKEPDSNNSYVTQIASDIPRYVVNNGKAELCVNGNRHGQSSYLFDYDGLIMFAKRNANARNNTKRRIRARVFLKEVGSDYEMGEAKELPAQMPLDLDQEELPSIKESKFEPREKVFELAPVDTHTTSPAEVQEWITFACDKYDELNRKYAELTIENVHVTAELEECKNKSSDGNLINFMESKLYNRHGIDLDTLIRIIDKSSHRSEIRELLIKYKDMEMVDGCMLPTSNSYCVEYFKRYYWIPKNGESGDAIERIAITFKGLIYINKLLRINGICLDWSV